MSYRDDIRRDAQARGIQWLVHFTPFVNLASIVEHGLIPRSELDANGPEYTYTDSWRLDAELGASSLSISDPARVMLERKRELSPRSTWAILFFEPSVLWTHDCRFCYRNASHADLSKCRKFRGGPWGFWTMFEDVAPTATFNGASYRAAVGLGPNQPTRVDAEVQVRGRIPPELIMGVGVSWARLGPKAQAIMDGLNQKDGGNRNVPFQEF
ncbi:DarT ssDNA thymidine ADP-ribosyltransferase family protein [Roseomonas sp. BN140053]|uniref:DarT ssDNA thymidine ADP-ribosyltransferase family protein n=1 Tax=Roseomonas sp. BN140053 TaxID=3391898 RepID=UPI0039E8E37D